MRQINKSKYFIIFELIIVALIATIISWQYIDKSPMYDEFYHILAAKSYIDHGEYSIHQGIYSRATLFTWLVSKSIYYFGDNLVSARLPALIAGILLVCVVFAWTRKTFDWSTAWIAAILLSVSPILVSAMQFSRFYTLHALLFFLFFVCAFYLINNGTGRGPKKTIMAMLGLLFLYLAFSLQVTTIIGAALLASYAVVILVWKYVDATYIRRNFRILGGLLLLLVVAVSIFYSEIMEIISLFNRFPLWAQSNINNKLYYLYTFKADYPLLFSVYPVLLIIATYLYPRAVLCLAIMFMGGFLVHSIAAMKSERYILYLLPMFVISSSIALSFLFKSLYKMLIAIVKNTFEELPISANPIVSSIIASVGLLTTLLFLVSSTEAIKAVPVMVSSEHYAEPYSRYYNNPDWRPVVDILQNTSSGVDVVVSSAAVKAFYYLSRLDYDLNASIRNEVGTKEFSIDSRTGFEVISSKESLQKIIESNHSGLIILEAGHLNNPAYVSSDIVNLIEMSMEKIIVPSSTRLWVYKWDYKNK